MAQLRLVLFTHPYCGLCVPVKDMITLLKNAPEFLVRPFSYHEVNIHAPGNEFWNTRYGMKIPVLYLYRYLPNQTPTSKSGLSRPRLTGHERGFWNDTLWQESWHRKNGDRPWSREELCVINFDTKESRFKNSKDMATWIWQH